MAPKSTTISHLVDAPAEAVWSVLTDLDGAVDTLRGVIAIERVSGTGYAVGTRWRETRKMMGKAETLELWVSEVEPQRRTVVKAQAGGVDYSTVFTLTAAGAGTQVDMEFSGASTDPSLRSRLSMVVFGSLGLWITRRVMAQDLRDIAAKAEATATR